MEKFKLVTYAERPELSDQFWLQKRRIWAPFMLHDTVTNPIWHHLYDAFPEYTFYLVNDAGEAIACGHTIPLHWDSTVAELPVGWNTSFKRGVDNYLAGVTPNTLMGIEASIRPEYTGMGLSYRLIEHMRTIAESRGLQAVIVPVRPSLKEHYPLTPMERYVRWAREDGLPFDPWLRVHVRLGGEIVKVCHPAMRIEGSVAQWEAWADMRFPESGAYVVPRALVPITIDRVADFGLYLEPNVWVHHPITTERLLP